MRLSLTLSFLVPFVLSQAGCVQRLTQAQKQQLEQRTADDLASLDTDSGALGGEILAASSARGTWENCWDAWGGCDVCRSLDGTAAAGTFAVSLEPETEGEACMERVTLNGASYAYTVTERAGEGSWVQEEDGYWNVSWTGNFGAELEISGSRNLDGLYDSSFTMNAANVVTAGDDDVRSWSYDWDYEGFLDRTWHVTVSRDETEAITGSIVGGDGTTCVISGVEHDYVVDCE